MGRTIKSAFALMFIICLIAMPQVSGLACKEAVTVCMEVLFPSLFPFFVLSDIFISSGGADFIGRYLKFIMKPLFGVNGNGGVALALGMISGYPIGAKVVCNLKDSGSISADEGKRLVCFTNNCGPMFIISALGTNMLLSRNIGIMLYVIHIVSSITLGIILKHFGDGASFSPPSGKVRKKQSSFTEAVENGMASIIRVSAFVIFFSVIIKAAEQLGAFHAIGKIFMCLGISKDSSVPLAQSLVEMSTGLKKLSASKDALSNKLIISSFVLGWSGISIILQSKSVSENLDIGLWQYALARFAHGCIGAIYTYIALRLPILSQGVFSGGAGISSAVAYTPRIGALLCIVIGISYIILQGRSKGKRQDSMQRRRAAR